MKKACASAPCGAHVLQVHVEAFALKILIRKSPPGLSTRVARSRASSQRTWHVACPLRVLHRNEINSESPTASRDLLEHGVFGEIALDEGNVGDRVHFQDIRSDEPALAANQTTGHLTTRPGPHPKVDTLMPGRIRAVLFLDLQQGVPLILGAMSEIWSTCESPTASRICWSTASSVKSPWMKVTSGIESISRISEAMSRPWPPIRRLVTCDHPPGVDYAHAGADQAVLGSPAVCSSHASGSRPSLFHKGSLKCSRSQFALLLERCTTGHLDDMRRD